MSPLEPRLSMAAPTPEPDTNPWAYIAVIKRQRRLVIAVPVALAVLTAIFTLVMPRKYIALASFVPAETGPSNAGALGAIASQFGVPALASLAGGSANASPQFYSALLGSQQVLHDVVTATYDVQGKKPFHGTLVDYIDPWAPTPVERELKAIKKLREDYINVVVDRQTGIVSVEVSTKSPDLSQEIADKLLAEINDFNLNRRQTQERAERDFSNAQAAQALADLRDAENLLLEFQENNRGYAQSPRLALQASQLERRVTLASSVYTQLQASYERSKIEAVRNTPLITILDRPEGLVAPAPRLLLAKTFIAFVIGWLAVLAWVLTADRLSAARRAHEMAMALQPSLPAPPQRASSPARPA